MAQFLYEGDSPLAERRAAALALDSTLLNELLGRVELRELLDAKVIEATERELQRLARTARCAGWRASRTSCASWVRSRRTRSPPGWSRSRPEPRAARLPGPHRRLSLSKACRLS